MRRGSTENNAPSTCNILEHLLSMAPTVTIHINTCFDAKLGSLSMLSLFYSFPFLYINIIRSEVLKSWSFTPFFRICWIVISVDWREGKWTKIFDRPALKPCSALGSAVTSDTSFNVPKHFGVAFNLLHLDFSLRLCLINDRNLIKTQNFRIPGSRYHNDFNIQALRNNEMVKVCIQLFNWCSRNLALMCE
jgi:hypothetical protein